MFKSGEKRVYKFDLPKIKKAYQSRNRIRIRFFQDRIRGSGKKCPDPQHWLEVYLVYFSYLYISEYIMKLYTLYS